MFLTTIFCVLICNIVDNTSASLSSLQGVVTSTQALRCQGPSLTPNLANYCRADLISHVTNWPAELLEKQVSYHKIVNKITSLPLGVPTNAKIVKNAWNT